MIPYYDISLISEDIEANSEGDILTTFDLEKNNPDNPYDGYLSALDTLAKIAYYDKVEYSKFDVLFGAGGNSLISSNIYQEFPAYKERLEEEILKDDRFDSVESVTLEKVDNNVFKINIKVLVKGSLQPIFRELVINQ